MLSPLLFFGVFWISSAFFVPIAPEELGRTLSGRSVSVACAATSSSTLEIVTPQPIGLYVHIPYCRRRCRYCDFAIVPIGNNGSSVSFSALNRNYTKALLTELEWIANTTNQNEFLLRSIYFGGGTPSLCPLETIETILSHIPFPIREDCEITMEIDPGTFTRQKLQGFKELGINRLSFGVQSFDDRILESIGRVHRVKDAWESIEMIRDVFGSDVNYSIDLISGLPGLTMALWIETLSIAMSINPRPKHISIYDLQIEQGTVFGSWYGNQGNSDLDLRRKNSNLRMKLPSDEECAMMYKYASGYLKTKGYEHYEVSSYALLTADAPIASYYRSRHNQIYWDEKGQWFAIGLGATSSIDRRSVGRPRAFGVYLQWVDARNFSVVEQKPSDEDIVLDIVLKRLRTKDGLSLDWIADCFGTPYKDAIVQGAQLAVELGLAHINNSNVLSLSDPDGLLFSNSIISTIFVEIENLQEMLSQEPS